MKFTFLIFGLGLLLVSCGSSKDPVVTAAQTKALDDLVTQKFIQIESEWAYPLVTSSLSSAFASGLLPPGNSPGAISLIGNSNYFKMHGDSISMHLPFYGERRLAGGYNSSDIAITYNGIPDQIEISKNEQKQVYKLSFLAKSNKESYRVFLTLSPGLNANIAVNSSHRTTMRYKGTVSKLAKSNSNVITLQ